MGAGGRGGSSRGRVVGARGTGLCRRTHSRASGLLTGEPQAGQMPQEDRWQTSCVQEGGGRILTWDFQRRPVQGLGGGDRAHPWPLHPGGACGRAGAEGPEAKEQRAGLGKPHLLPPPSTRGGTQWYSTTNLHPQTTNITRERNPHQQGLKDQFFSMTAANFSQRGHSGPRKLCSHWQGSEAGVGSGLPAPVLSFYQQLKGRAVD